MHRSSRIRIQRICPAGDYREGDLTSAPLRPESTHLSVESKYRHRHACLCFRGHKMRDTLGDPFTVVSGIPYSPRLSSQPLPTEQTHLDIAGDKV